MSRKLLFLEAHTRRPRGEERGLWKPNHMFCYVVQSENKNSAEKLELTHWRLSPAVSRVPGNVAGSGFRDFETPR